MQTSGPEAGRPQRRRRRGSAKPSARVNRVEALLMQKGEIYEQFRSAFWTGGRFAPPYPRPVCGLVVAASLAGWQPYRRMLIRTRRQRTRRHRPRGPCRKASARRQRPCSPRWCMIKSESVTPVKLEGQMPGDDDSLTAGACSATCPNCGSSSRAARSSSSTTRAAWAPE